MAAGARVTDDIEEIEPPPTPDGRGAPETPPPEAAAQDGAGASMEIHRPKAAHSWREFLIEIGTIVIGILIALSLEQAVEALHEHSLAREAREAIDAEMQVDLDRVAYRLSQQACVDKRLNQISGLLATWAGGQGPPPGLAVGDPGDVALVAQRWQANLNSGRFSRQPAKAQGEQAAFYTDVAVLDDMQKREHYVWSDLRTLELGPDVLRADQRPSLVSALQTARTLSGDVRQLGQQALEIGKSAGLTPRPMQEIAILGTSCRPLIPSAAAGP